MRSTLRGTTAYSSNQSTCEFALSSNVAMGTRGGGVGGDGCGSEGGCGNGSGGDGGGEVDGGGGLGDGGGGNQVDGGGGLGDGGEGQGGLGGEGQLPEPQLEP